MAYMYILECADGSYYTGSTRNLNRRLWQHQKGIGANYTHKYLPVKLVYCEEYHLVKEAFYREKEIQGWNKAKKKALIESDFEKLHTLAKCKNKTNSENIKSLNDHQTERSPSGLP